MGSEKNTDVNVPMPPMADSNDATPMVGDEGSESSLGGGCG
jgi:hypothetical protein